MAMPQQDDYIEQIHRLEGLMAYAGKTKKVVDKSKVALDFCPVSLV